MALLQPAPEVYNLFDDIMLLAEGHIVYYGPKEEVCTPCRRLCGLCLVSSHAVQPSAIMALRQQLRLDSA